MARTMYHHCSAILLSIALLAVSVLSQTITTTDLLGETIVEVITIDPLLGLPTTQTLQTLTDPLAATPTSSTTDPLALPPATSSTTSSITTPLAPATPVPQGPVGAPPATTLAGPTVYTYTTTDANGATIGVVDTFTPIYAPSTPYTAMSTGTILPYSQWLSMVGGASAAASAEAQLSSGSQSLKLGGSMLHSMTGCLAGILAGAWVVLA
ncbi:hypothetical protein PsYK624_017520 [Phanerochaete sordida]|uniref:Uncharacterized protein n=1 Tax=Phanerochaete sordida TaxID=48140 RepID=A0A9P3FZX0_9APHY|nr:hypothetical protein PsYK624_017520 [Phanerochaete sordida]